MGMEFSPISVMNSLAWQGQHADPSLLSSLDIIYLPPATCTLTLSSLASSRDATFTEPPPSWVIGPLHLHHIILPSFCPSPPTPTTPPSSHPSVPADNLFVLQRLSRNHLPKPHHSLKTNSTRIARMKHSII